MKQCTFFSALCSHRGDNTFLLAMRFFWPSYCYSYSPLRSLILPLSLSLHYSRSIRASVGVWTQLCRGSSFRRETQTISCWVTNSVFELILSYFLKDFWPSRQQMPKQFISNLNATFVVSVYSDFPQSYGFVHSSFFFISHLVLPNFGIPLLQFCATPLYTLQYS